MALIRCKECGKQISSLASICLNCGCPVDPDATKELQCGNCKTIVREDDNYCPGCGYSFNPDEKKKYKCPNCEIEVLEENKFCPNCGINFKDEEKIEVKGNSKIKNNINFFIHLGNIIISLSILLAITSFILGIILATGAQTTESAIITFVAYTVSSVILIILGLIISAPVKWKAYMLKTTAELNNKIK